MSKETIIYTAGLFDGEGTVTLCKVDSKSQLRRPSISMSSTSLELLQFLKEEFGGSISKHKKYKKHHRQSWSWSLCYDSAIKFMELIYPYIKELKKRKRMKMILDNYKNLTPRNGQYSQDELIAKLSFQEEFFSI